MKNFKKHITSLKTILASIVFLIFSPIVVVSQCANIGFELSSPGTYTNANVVSGWTISSQTNSGCSTNTLWTAGSNEFAILQTPLLNAPNIGTLTNSPLGGNNVAQLNFNSANSSVTKAAYTHSVTIVNEVIQIAYAGAWQTSNHNCCDQAFFKIQLRDCSGNIVSCPSFTFAAPGCSGIPTYSTNNGTSWTSWKMQYIDVSAFFGSCVTIEAIAGDCSFGDHFGYAYLDLRCPQFLSPVNCLCATVQAMTIDFCPSTSLAVINAPLGYVTYSWTAPIFAPLPSSQTSVAALTITNAIVGAQYTLNVTSPSSNCSPPIIFTLAHSSVSIAGVVSNSSCVGGTSGSATVMAAGNPSGQYNYIWTNTSNSVVSTSSFASNLPVGIYSVSVTATGNSSCGIATTTVNVAASPTNNVQSLLKVFCPSQPAYFNAPPGTSYQWYNNSAAVSNSLGGNNSNYTVAASQLANVQLSYFSVFGCRDSMAYTLVQTVPGILTLSNNSVCANATNGSLNVTITPAAGSPFGQNGFTVVSSSSSTPNYSASMFQSTLNTYSVSNLSALGQYSINVFDGSCKYDTVVTINPFQFDYTVSPIGSPTICSGSSIVGGIVIPSQQAAAYSFSWNPSIFLNNNQTMFPISVITPTAANGSINNIIYSITITPSVINCPLTTTINISAANLTPTISTIPAMCSNVFYSLSVLPSGGVFASFNSNNISPISQLGIIDASLANPGINTFTYTVISGSCSQSSQSAYIVNGPTLTLAPQHTICSTENITLVASGANTYSWNNGVLANSIMVSPTATSIFSVTGTDTNFCSRTATTLVNVLPSPKLNLSGSLQICSGKSTTLHVSGAVTYTWYSGENTSSIILNPNSTSTYSVSGTGTNNCKRTNTFEIVVIPTPTIMVTGNLNLCPGQSTTLNASGAQTYYWSNGQSGQSVVLTPTVTNIYSVTGYNINCFSMTPITVIVNCTNNEAFEPESSSVLLYPNPSSGLFFVRLKSAGAIKVFNGIGQMVIESTTAKEDHTIELSGFADGVYKVVIFNSTSFKSIKLVKTANK